MPLNNLEIFSYPKFVVFEVERIVSIVSKYPDVLSVILIGSCSRGELIYTENTIESDIELFIIAKPYYDINLDSDLGGRLKSDDVDIDFTILSEKQFSMMKPKLILADTLATGICIYGLDILINYPRLRVDDLAQDDIDEIVLFRLLDVYTAGKLGDKLAAYNNGIKNVLYLLTWSLVKDGILAHSFNDKVDIFKSDQSLPITKSVFDGCEFLIDMAVRVRRGYIYTPERNIELALVSVYSRVVDELEKKPFETIGIERLKNLVYAFRGVRYIGIFQIIANINYIFKDTRILIVRALLMQVVVNFQANDGNEYSDDCQLLNDNKLIGLVSGYYPNTAKKLRLINLGLENEIG